MAITSFTSRGEIAGSGTSLSGASSSIAAGKAFAVCVRWDGSGVTISGTPTITGETVALNATSHSVNASNSHCQWLTVESASATGTKSLSVTFSGSTSACGAIFVEIDGNGSSWLGTIKVDSSDQAIAPSTLLNTSAAGSGFLACVMASGNPGVPSGTGIVQLALADNFNYEDGQYRLDCGAAGNQIVAWPTAVSNWAISAIEVKGAPATPIEQEGARARNDDGSETAATWVAAQDSNFNHPLDTNLRMRYLLNATGDPATAAFRLEYKLSTDGTYLPVEANGSAGLATGTAGTVGTGGTTTCNVPYPASIAAGMLLVAVVGNRPNANTPADISGWTKYTGTGGTGSEAADTGVVRATIYTKVADGTETGNLAVSCTGGTSMFGTMLRYSKDTGKNWAVAVAFGDDSSAGTSWSATAAGDPGLAAGDFLVCASICSVDTARAASEAVTATGCTFGTMTEKVDAGITTGNDLSMVVADFPVSTGPSSAAPVYTMTMSGTQSASSAGPTAFIRLRQVVQPIQLALSSNIAAGGEATTAQLTAPSGKSTSDFVAGRMWDDENGTDSLDITVDDYTEVEWCIKALAAGGAANSQQYNLRVTKAGVALDTYTVSPVWTIGTGGGAASILRQMMTQHYG